MKHPMTSTWDIAKTSQWYVCLTSWSQRKRRDKVQRVSNNNIPLGCLYDLSNYSQIKQSMTSWWYVAKTSQGYFSTMSHKNVEVTSHSYLNMTSHKYISSSKSQMKHPMISWWYVSTKSLKYVARTPCYSSCLRRCQVMLSWSPTGRLHLNLKSNKLYYL